MREVSYIFCFCSGIHFDVNSMYQCMNIAKKIIEGVCYMHSHNPVVIHVRTSRHKTALIEHFLYFPLSDNMLATSRAYVWRTESQVMLRGVLLIVVLLRISKWANIPSEFWSDAKIPHTKLNEAALKEKVKLNHARASTCT